MSSGIAQGLPEPWGATPIDGGVNFAVFSAHAQRIELCLFDDRGEREVARLALPGRTGDVWHGFVPGLRVGTRYGFRAHGPFDPTRGHRFDRSKLLVDPWARAIDRPFALHPSLFSIAPDGRRNPADSAPFVPKAIATVPLDVHARLPSIAWAHSIVYELHVRGLTMRHPAVPDAIRGTCAALAAPPLIDHLRRLGVTTVELMPIASRIDERHLVARGLVNYWGYNPVAMQALEPRLAPGGIGELAQAVATLHDAGIEVVLDVVFNHTGEGDELGPTVCYRGLDNASYYRLREDDASRYVDDAGCGNVLACERPHVVRLVLDALRHFVIAVGIDGVRFDLGTTLGRRGNDFDSAAPLLAAIAQDPLLASCKLIVEPWDLGRGGYRLGEFPPTWGEWNDRYRDAARRFFRGDAGMRGEMATRFAGSADIFAPRHRPVSRSVNFVAVHDGFTLADLVSHAVKHNEANGEDNRDGTDRNDSWNHGHEGASDDPTIRGMRAQDVRSLISALAFSRGTPMLGMGDELGRTQRGNNNTYCQDGPLAWVDWHAADEALIAFASRTFALRSAHPALRDEHPLTGAPRDASGIPDVEWLRADGHAMDERDWRDAQGRTLIAALYVPAEGARAADRVLVVLHAGLDPIAVRLPDPRDVHDWVRAADSAAPREYLDRQGPAGAVTNVAPRSVVLFVEVARASPSARTRGVEPAALARLASAAGISTEWWDVAGTRYRTSPETLRALLAALGLGVDSTADARARLAEIGDADRRPLPVTTVVPAGSPSQFSLPDAGSSPVALVLTREDGEPMRIVVDAAGARRIERTSADGRAHARLVVDLPALPAGVHRLALDHAPETSATILATPGRCHVPPALDDGHRAFGIAAHLYSLRRPADLGIGDFGALRELAIASAARGAATVALNPLHALFPGDRERASPYHPSDRRFLDPIYIDVERVPDFAASPDAHRMLVSQAAAIAELCRASHVDYPRVWAIKRDVLAACYRTFAARGAADPLRRDFERFVARGGDALARFAVFDAIAQRHPGVPWPAWPAGLRAPQGDEVAAFASRHEDSIGFACYLQWLADLQLEEAADAARANGLAIGLYRDLAVGAAPDGAEVWADAAGFAHGVSIGAPPDPFAPAGQVWCVPPLNPRRMADDGYARFRSLVASNLRHAGALRIDHVMGLTRLFYVPDGARAADGAYVDYPLDALLAALALESVRAQALIVGEDLGTVPEGFRDRLDAAGVFSSAVIWLEREGADFRRAARWRRNAAASVSTHDLPTIAGWWSGADIAERERVQPDAIDGDAARAERAADRMRLVDRLRGENALAPDASDSSPHVDAIAPALHRMLADSPAALVLVQADDLAGERDALNLPGTDRERANWRRRLSVEAQALWTTPIGEAAARDLARRRVDPAAS